MIPCTYRYVYVTTCVCMYVDYARAYMIMHTCRCESVSKLVIIMCMGNLVNMSIYIFVRVSVYVYMCTHV